MTITVNGPNGLTINFPEGTTPDIINKVMLEATTGKTAPGSAPASDVSMAEDIAKSAGAGVIRGGIGLASLPGTIEQASRWGINKLFGKNGQNVVSPETALPTYKDVQGTVENKIGNLYEPQTRAGKYAGTAGEFATGMLFPGGGAAGVAAQAANRGIRNVVVPAIASETAGQVTEGTAAEPYARVAGAMAGPFAMTPFSADPNRARMVQALNNEGVTAITAGQATGRKPLRWAESAIQDVPFTGHRAQNLNTQAAEQYTAAALRRAGIDAPRATPEVIDQALTRIGAEFDAIAQNVQVPVTRGLAQRVQDIAQRYERVTEPSLTNRLPSAIADDIAQRGQGGWGNPNFFIRGDQYQGWRSDIGAAARATQDPRTRRALYDIQHELDNAAENYLRLYGNTQMVDRMQNARREYRNIIVIEKAAGAAGEAAAVGLISPSSLRNAVKAAGLRDYVRGRGDFAELARAGEAILKPLPQSGTAPRMIAQELGKAAVGGALGGTAYGQEGAAAGAALPILTQALMGRAIMSRPGQAYLRNQVAAGPAIGLGSNRALASALATQTELSDKRKKDRR